MLEKVLGERKKKNKKERKKMVKEKAIFHSAYIVNVFSTLYSKPSTE